MSVKQEYTFYEITTSPYDDPAPNDDPNESDGIPIKDEDSEEFNCTICFKEFPCLINLQRHYIVHITNKPYPCRQCDKSFFTATALEKHTESHKNDKFYPCNVCEVVLTGKSSYNAHMKSHDIPAYTCNGCLENFPTKLLLRQHERTHTSARENDRLDYKCVLCDFVFILQRELEDHMDEHERVCQHTCKKCDKSFFYSYLLQKHISRHNLQEVVCNVCKKSFEDKHRLHEHEQVHLLVYLDAKNILRYACELCSVMFPLKDDLETHYNDSHDGVCRFPCTMCFESFFFSYMLLKHKKTHMEFKNIICELCSQSFKTNSYLAMHMKTKHSEKEFKCQQCDKTFATKRRLQLHNASHTTTKPFKCDICGFAFKLKTNRDRHYSRHSDTKRFKCQKCDETFTRSTGLNHHMKLHNRDPIPCKDCGKVFMSETSFGKHVVRVHMKREPTSKCYVCGFCGKIMKHDSTYRVHLRQHTGERPFKCKYCGRTFVQRPHLIGHHKFHHRDLKLVIELPFKCAYCEHSCLKKTGLQKHHARFHRELEFRPQLNVVGEV